MLPRKSPPEAASAGGRRGPTLKGRGLRYLAQREHSRHELARKLAPHAESAEQLDSLLDDLQRERLLSDRRFVESVVQRRSPRHGLLRLRHDLGQHGLDPSLVGDALQSLRSTEAQRALDAWRRRFGELPGDARERARQQRFLAQRGFEAETIRQLFRQLVAAGSASADDVER